MKPTIIFIIGISIAFFLAGCVPKSSTSAEYGTEGLRLTLTAGMSNIVYEDTPITITADVENRGTSTIDHGILVINAPSTYFSKSKQLQQELFLQGRQLDEPVGEQQQYTFNVHVKKLLDAKKQYSALLSAQTCYQYTTTASPTVCVQMPGDKKPACKQGSVSMSGQGAPLAVTKVETAVLPMENPQRVRPFVTITIANKGGGAVLDPDSVLGACLSSPEETPKDVAFLTASLDHEGRQLTCGIAKEAGQTKVQLKKGSATITCDYPTGIPVSEGTHTSQILIKLIYGYTSTSTKTVTIKARAE